MIHEQVGLQAHAVDQLLFPQGLQDVLDDVVALPFLRCLIVVVEKGDGRIGVFPGEPEGLQYIILAHCFRPEGFPDASLVHRLIYHIPGVDHAGVGILNKSQHTADVGFQTREHRFAIRKRIHLIVPLMEEPFGGLIMPDQSVTAHRDPFLFCKFQIRDRVVKPQSGRAVIRLRVPLVLPAVQKIHRLHIVFAGATVELVTQEL